jgi:hypothetical protein
MIKKILIANRGDNAAHRASLRRRLTRLGGLRPQAGRSQIAVNGDSSRPV